MADEHREIDEEILDGERAAALSQLADLVLDMLDAERWTEIADAERVLRRQVDALEREGS